MGGVAWTEEEDHLLKKCIEQYGEGKWHRVPVLAGLNRCRKSCRLRWLNYLRPNIRRGTFTDNEVLLIIKLHNHLGNRWSLIASRLPGRTANDVKNFWNCHLSKKLNKLHHNDNHASLVAINSQVSFTAHYSFEATTGILSTTSSTGGLEDKEISTHMGDTYGFESGQALSNGAMSINCQRGEADCQTEMNDLASKFEFEETSFKGEGDISNMNCIWDWDELIFDMDLWG